MNLPLFHSRSVLRRDYYPGLPLAMENGKLDGIRTVEVGTVSSVDMMHVSL